jgi:NTP pyrophosphatase (non-canonical NTP hydrolase)
MHTREVQEHARELKDAHGWRNVWIERRALFLVTEVGEMAKEVLQLARVSSHAEREQLKDRLGMEMYDVVWNLCDLANLVGIDLEASFAKKRDLNRQHTW